MTVANGLVDAAEATRDPWALSFALFCGGYAFSEAEPNRALRALRRGLVVAQDSGGRYNITILAAALSRLESKYGSPPSNTLAWRSATTTTRAISP